MKSKTYTHALSGEIFTLEFPPSGFLLVSHDKFTDFNNRDNYFYLNAAKVERLQEDGCFITFARDTPKPGKYPYAVLKPLPGALYDEFDYHEDFVPSCKANVGELEQPKFSTSVVHDQAVAVALATNIPRATPPRPISSIGQPMRSTTTPSCRTKCKRHLRSTARTCDARGAIPSGSGSG